MFFVSDGGGFLSADSASADAARAMRRINKYAISQESEASRVGYHRVFQLGLAVPVCHRGQFCPTEPAKRVSPVKTICGSEPSKMM